MSLCVFPSVIWLISRELLALVSQNTQNWHLGRICLARCDQKKGVTRRWSFTHQTKMLWNCKHRPQDWIQQVFNSSRQKAQTCQWSLIFYCSWRWYFSLSLSLILSFSLFFTWTQSKVLSKPNLLVEIHPIPFGPCVSASLSYGSALLSVPDELYPFFFVFLLSLLFPPL